MSEDNVVQFVPPGSVGIPIEPLDFYRHARVTAEHEQGARLDDTEMFCDADIISHHRLTAFVFHGTRNAALRRGMDEALVDECVDEAVATELSRRVAIESGADAEALKATGLPLAELPTVLFTRFLLSAAAKLANVQDEFDRRRLVDPSDPSVQ